MEGFSKRLKEVDASAENMLYNIFKFNCEHFANYLRSDEWVSDQVMNGLAVGGGVLGALAVAGGIGYVGYQLLK